MGTSRPFLALRLRSAAAGGPDRPALQVVASDRNSGSRRLLDGFWRARGVVDEQLRGKIVEVGLSGLESGASMESWQVDSRGGSKQVVEVSRQLLALAELLGSGKEYGDVDVVWMVLREPRLLTTKVSRMRAMLLQMKVAEGCEAIDVAKVCEAQPSLLLQDVTDMDQQESFAQRMLAWQHGFVTDNDAEWSRRHEELQEYMKLNGDAHVGCRTGDDKDLARWAKKQRAAFKSGDLSDDRLNMSKQPPPQPPDFTVS